MTFATAHLLEKYLEEFFRAVPEAIPADRDPAVSPIAALGAAHGLTVHNARRYIYWLVDTKRVTDDQGAGLLAVVMRTDEATSPGATLKDKQALLPRPLEQFPHPWALCTAWEETLNQYVRDTQVPSAEVAHAAAIFAGLLIGKILATAPDATRAAAAVEEHLPMVRSYIQMGLQRARTYGGAPLATVGSTEAPLASSPGAAHTTHEPPLTNWPDGHVGVTLTDADVEECLAVRVHDSVHYLHATTARALQKGLQQALDQVNKKMRAAGLRRV